MVFGQAQDPGRQRADPGRPDRLSGVVSVSGYNVHNTSAASSPEAPQFERTTWYQYYLHGERGHAGLAAFRREFTRLFAADGQ